MIKFNFHFDNHGFAQIHFTKKVKVKGKNIHFHYCAQENGQAFNFLRCSKDGEPSHRIDVNWSEVDKVKNPLTSTAEAFNKFLEMERE